MEEFEMQETFASLKFKNARLVNLARNKALSYSLPEVPYIFFALREE
jgi:hypothetical protein